MTLGANRSTQRPPVRHAKHSAFQDSDVAGGTSWLNGLAQTSDEATNTASPRLPEITVIGTNSAEEFNEEQPIGPYRRKQRTRSARCICHGCSTCAIP